ncbi:phenylacetate-CoA oxygenase subunit PaaC [Streptomyces sp. RB6PN25]|uniref:Phenylacetate-CoA oxygenase subunit PaaC n=1 Tax=Streptomyces humicola TaxID=2953240 RepID=A0ABT1PXJ9_9ACTN|nr:1,2-phenylacetyl-CoA epoxidase subunit PaaC [Streptomyces humicola]MCQ4082392.1 phenylacetate-CoA oxygenase subunit PaaC [Streptomyces humicola]
MTDDHVYLSLAEGSEDGDARWAFGTGFEDPLHGVDTVVPEVVDGRILAAYCLALGDDALVSAQRLAEWCTRAPELEEEVALANIGLDLLGQARLLLSRAGQAEGSGRDEDALAYFRDADALRNVRLAELPNGDFAFSIARLLVLATWRLALFERLTGSTDPVLAAVAAKGVKELTYHRDYAAQWTVRLGDGTCESHLRMQRGIEEIWPYVGELFATGPVEREAAAGGIGVDPAAVREEVGATLLQVADAATLALPALPADPHPGGGRWGEHTDALGPLLAEMQSVARAHPEATW